MQQIVESATLHHSDTLEALPAFLISFTTTLLQDDPNSAFGTWLLSFLTFLLFQNKCTSYGNPTLTIIDSLLNDVGLTYENLKIIVKQMGFGLLGISLALLVTGRSPKTVQDPIEFMTMGVGEFLFTLWYAMFYCFQQDKKLNPERDQMFWMKAICLSIISLVANGSHQGKRYMYINPAVSIPASVINVLFQGYAISSLALSSIYLIAAFLACIITYQVYLNYMKHSFD